MRYSMLLVVLTGFLLITITHEQRGGGGGGYGRIVPGLFDCFYIGLTMPHKRRKSMLECSQKHT